MYILFSNDCKSHFSLRIIYSAFRVLESQTKLTFIEHLLCGSHSSKDYPWLHSFNPSNSPTTWAPSLSPFRRGERWSSRKWSDLPTVPGYQEAEPRFEPRLRAKAEGALWTLGCSHPSPFSHITCSQWMRANSPPPASPSRGTPWTLFPGPTATGTLLWLQCWWKHTGTPKILLYIFELRAILNSLSFHFKRTLSLIAFIDGRVTGARKSPFPIPSQLYISRAYSNWSVWNLVRQQKSKMTFLALPIHSFVQRLLMEG